MKAKKPLLVTVLVLALLAVALILPAAATGESDAQPVNWVKGSYNTSNTRTDCHIGFTVNVQQFESDPLKGFVLQKIVFTENDAFDEAPVVRRATEFWPENDLWAYIWLYETGLNPMYLENYASFHEAGGVPGYSWPSDLIPPAIPPDYDQANIADFVIYLPAGFLGLGCETMPHRYLILDFDEPGREDLVQIYGWVGFWMPMLSDTGDLVPVPAGNFQVHVGETDS